jgi:hypothetical protein
MPEAKRFLLRLDPALFEALRRWADDDMRSINAQIEYLLVQEVRRAGRLPKRAPSAPSGPPPTPGGPPPTPSGPPPSPDTDG